MNTSVRTAVAVAAAATAAAQLVDITEFDVVGACERGHEFELRNPDGSSTGIKLSVLGSFAPEVVAHGARLAEQLINEQRLAQRKGKMPKAKTMDELKAQNIESAVVRVVGWSGVRQPYTTELLRAALGRNPHWIPQVIEAADDLGNFGTTSASSSEPT